MAEPGGVSAAGGVTNGQHGKATTGCTCGLAAASGDAAACFRKHSMISLNAWATRWCSRWFSLLLTVKCARAAAILPCRTPTWSSNRWHSSCNPAPAVGGVRSAWRSLTAQCMDGAPLVRVAACTVHGVDAAPLVRVAACGARARGRWRLERGHGSSVHGQFFAAGPACCCDPRPAVL